MRRLGAASAIILPLVFMHGSGSKWVFIGPFGGQADVVAAHPASGVLVAASRAGLLHRSNDAGEHWWHIPFPAEQMSMVHALMFDAADDKRYFAAVSHEQAGASGLFVTADDGVSWKAVPEFRGKAVWSLATAPGVPDTLAAGASDGVYRSDDRGNTWRRISPHANLELQPVVSLAFDPRDARILFAGTPHLPWRTADAGATWQSIHAGMLDDSDVFSIAVVPRRPEQVFASACSGMYRSGNGGLLWTKLRGSLDASFRTYVILPDPNDPLRVYSGTTGGLQRSTDGGATWQRVHPAAVRSIAVDPANPRRLYAASVKGLLRSDDGGDNFRPFDNGFSGHNPSRMFSSATALLTSTGSTLLATSDGGASWRAATGPKDVRAVAAQEGLAVAAGAQALWSSGDDGKTWKTIGGPPVKGAYTALGLMKGAPVIWAGTTHGLMAFTRAGAEWRGTPVQALENKSVEVIAVDGAQPRAAVASRREAFFTIDRGTTWRPLTAPSPNAEWTSLAFGRGEDVLLGGTSRGIFFSNDAGTHWQQSAGLTADAAVTSVFFHPGKPRIAFAVEQGAALISNDGGRTFSPFRYPGPDAPVRSLAVLPNLPERVFALVAGHGVYAAGIDSKVTNPE